MRRKVTSNPTTNERQSRVSHIDLGTDLRCRPDSENLPQMAQFRNLRPTVFCTVANFSSFATRLREVGDRRREFVIGSIYGTSPRSRYGNSTLTVRFQIRKCVST